ncbi:MAG: hypothetical protein WCT47_20690 [Betaproteobacteria bacterium]
MLLRQRMHLLSRARRILLSLRLRTQGFIANLRERFARLLQVAPKGPLLFGVLRYKLGPLCGLRCLCISQRLPGGVAQCSELRTRSVLSGLQLCRLRFEP